LPAEELDSLMPSAAAVAPHDVAGPSDVLIERVDAPALAFFKSSCPVTVHVRNDGPAQDAELVWKQLGREGSGPETRQKVSLRQGRQAVEISLVPGNTGRLAFSASLAGLARDDDPTNNTVPFGLTVSRDVIRVLHIAGAPSWDVRFLRQLLTTAPGVELISFYLLVEAQDFAPHAADELSLIPFPTDELFLEEMGNFDLVVVQNFPLGTYFQLRKEHLEKLEAFVNAGGGVLFIGGNRAFSVSDIEGTPADAILPVEARPEGFVPPYTEAPAVFDLTADGAVHPIAAGDPEQDTAEFPVSLPMLSGVNMLGRVRPGGTVLATASFGGPADAGVKEGGHSGAEASSGPGTASRSEGVAGAPLGGAPLVVAGTHGKGRVIVIATDSLWRWAFPPASSGESRALYHRLFLNAIAWLTGDPRSDEVVIGEQHVPVVEGEETRMEACWRHSAEVPAKGTMLADWLDPSSAGALHVELPLAFDKGRCASFALPPAKPGAWVLSAATPDRSGVSGGAVVAVYKKAPTERERLLKKAASLLAMRFVPWTLDQPFAATLLHRELPLDKPVVTPLWDHPGFFALIVAALLAEWVLRRRWGYL